MPVYDYRCGTCQQVFRNVYRACDQSESGPECCGGSSSLVWLSAPGVIGKGAFESYLSPCDGRPITSERARREDLARNGCVPYEDGIKQDQQRRAKQEEADTERLVEKIVSEAAERTTVPIA